MNKVTLIKGDCIKQLKKLKDNSVDSVVTDPPYHLTAWDMQPKKKYKRKNKGFMGKEWDGLDKDGIGIANNPKLWKEVLRVLKPGGHLLSFSHSRTYHRQAVAVEDAGFEIRDQIMWIYGSGFPKSHNIGKSVDKIQGNEREVVGVKKNQGDIRGKNGLSGEIQGQRPYIDTEITKGTSPYEGWGTALKPAHEPIVMARKPFKGSVAKNVLEYGTGGINIDECRVGTEKVSTHSNGVGKTGDKGIYGTFANQQGSEEREGRFPANIIFDEEAGKILDEQTGILKTGAVTKETNNGANQSINLGGGLSKVRPADEGGASRFFYCPKASKKDRNEGNIHPTVKPTDLMAYLVRLVTPKGGVVLDPFMGSGSTGKASVREGMDFIGIEREDEYMEIAKTRIQHEEGKHNYRTFFDI